MLEKVKKFFKDKERVLNTLNAILGLLMITALVVFWKTGNRISMYIVIFSGGLMNLCNGYKYMQQKERKTIGYSMILLGVVVLMLGIFVLLV